MPEQTVRIATRKSPLAMWQAEHVAAELKKIHPGITVELLGMSTKGDRILDAQLLASFFANTDRIACLDLRRRNIDDLDFESEMLRVTGKGNKQRIVPVGSPALEAVRAWLPERRKIINKPNARGRQVERQAVFINGRGGRLTCSQRTLALVVPVAVACSPVKGLSPPVNIS